MILQKYDIQKEVKKLNEINNEILDNIDFYENLDELFNAKNLDVEHEFHELEKRGYLFCVSGNFVVSDFYTLIEYIHDLIKVDFDFCMELKNKTLSHYSIEFGNKTKIVLEFVKIFPTFLYKGKLYIFNKNCTTLKIA